MHNRRRGDKSELSCVAGGVQLVVPPRMGQPGWALAMGMGWDEMDIGNGKCCVVCENRGTPTGKHNTAVLPC